MPPSQICFKTILRIFDGFEYSTNFFCQKVKKSSNIRSHRIFEDFVILWQKKFVEYSKPSNIRRMVLKKWKLSKRIWEFEYSKSYIRQRCTNLLKKFLKYIRVEYSILTLEYFKREKWFVNRTGSSFIKGNYSYEGLI